MANRFVVFLDCVGTTLAAVGGKGARLAELIRAGFPVPPAFAITSAAYRAFVEANGIDSRIAQLSDPVPGDDSDVRQSVSQIIRDCFGGGAIPRQVCKDIEQAYSQLTSGRHGVAIRSSATVEDQADASSAGQQETFLNVRTEDELFQAVRRCWSSLWSVRALAYRTRRNLGDSHVSLAVVIQLMAPAETAGVLFTANPVNGNRDEIVINASWGLGEAIVSGRVTPDVVVADKATGRVLFTEVNDKLVMTVVSTEGTTDMPVEARRRHRLSLNETQAAELARLGREIESHFNAPQDIEWAIADDKAYILQARPITALPEASAVQKPRIPGDDDWWAREEKPAQPFDLWTQTNVGEVWPNPVSPLVWSVAPEIIGGGIRYALRGLNSSYLEGVQWVKRFHGRVYYNEGALAHVLSHDLGLPGTLTDGAVGTRRESDDGRDARIRPLPFLRRLPFVVRVAKSQLATGREFEALFPQIDRWVADFRAGGLDELSDREVWASISRWMDHFRHVMNLHTELSVVALTTFGMLDWLMHRWFGRRDLSHDLVTGISGLIAAEMGPALSAMARKLDGLGLAGVVLDNEPAAALARLRAAPDAGPVLKMLDSFLERHGHRCPSEGEWLHPRWADAPEQVVDLVAAYLRAGARVNPQEAKERQRRRRDDALAWATGRLDAVRRAVFRFILARVEHAVRMRDNGKHYYMKTSYPLRRLSWEFGLRWAGRGWLAQPEDVFFLTIQDIERVVEAGKPASVGLDLSRVVAGRRRAFEYWFGVDAPNAIGPDGRPLETPDVDDPSRQVLRGLPASGGRASGKARVVHDPREATRLQTSDILVTRATDPGWTPVFPLVAGLVTEVGGQLSHAVIVAREYGLPAVVNVRRATHRIADGQAITVDGTAGKVYLDSAYAD